MQAGFRPPAYSSEDCEWRNDHEFHVTFILEDVAVTARVARDIGVVVILGEVQFEHRAFRTALLKGLNRIQTV